MAEKHRIMLRIDKKLYDKLRYLSYAECRSINSEIERTIAQYIKAWEAKYGAIPDRPDTDD